MKLSTLHNLILSAQECDTLEIFALECGGSLPETIPDEEAFPILEKIYNFANDYNFSHVRALSGLSQRRFALEYNIPVRSIENWDSGTNKAPNYVLELLFLNVIE